MNKLENPPEPGRPGPGEKAAGAETAEAARESRERRKAGGGRASLPPGKTKPAQSRAEDTQQEPPETGRIQYRARAEGP